MEVGRFACEGRDVVRSGGWTVSTCVCPDSWTRCSDMWHFPGGTGKAGQAHPIVVSACLICSGPSTMKPELILAPLFFQTIVNIFLRENVAPCRKAIFTSMIDFIGITSPRCVFS